MKRKRISDQIDDPQVCDLILTDSNGRSIRVHKALLMDKSDYFAQVLTDHNLNELRINENYFIELIQYLYNHEQAEERRQIMHPENRDDDNDDGMELESDLVNQDTEILMQLLALSRKYSFKQLYRHLMNEINYKLRPQSVLIIFSLASNLGVTELVESTKLMILSWLPQLQKTRAFYNLSEDSIYNIFAAEAPDIDNECKLNALSAWWSHNKEADMTRLWVKLISFADK